MPKSTSQGSQMRSSLHSRHKTTQLRKRVAVEIAISNKKRYGLDRLKIKPKSNLLIPSLTNPILNRTLIIHNNLKIPTSNKHPGHPSNLQYSHYEKTNKRTINSRNDDEKEKQINRYQKNGTWTSIQPLHEEIVTHVA